MIRRLMWLMSRLFPYNGGKHPGWKAVGLGIKQATRRSK
jgi:hypothetical protein